MKTATNNPPPTKPSEPQNHPIMASDGAPEAQLGREVDTTPARKPSVEYIDGAHVRLERLSLDHVNDLYESTAGLGTERLWDYFSIGPFDSLDTFQSHIKSSMEATSAVYYAIIDPTSSRAVGFFAYINIELKHRDIEIGYVTFGRLLQRTRASTEAIYLLLRHAFEELGFRRCVWKCSSLNGPSKNAAVRYGFTYEGTFRQHQIIKGRNRDTAWYSMLDAEWPERKKALERWLEDGNFDEHGKQRKSLVEIRDSVSG